MAITVVAYSSSHKLIGRSLEILKLCTVLKNLEPVYVKHEKCIFVPQGEYSRMRTINLNLMIAERWSGRSDDNRTQKIHITYIFKR